MGVQEADELQKIIEKAEKWPVWQADYAGGVSAGAAPQQGQYGRSAKEMELFVAMREHDRKQIAHLIGWPADRPYKIDPLPERISQAYSDLLYGDDPVWQAANEADEDALQAIVEANDLPSELRSACADCSSEGEVWYRVYVDPDESDYPVLQFHSRLDVIPLFHGRRLAAAAFVSVLFIQEELIEQERVVKYWRHIEIQTDGLTRNLLYKGTLGELGTLTDLSAQVETEDLPEEWQHGLDVMLAGRVFNKRGRDFRLGTSDYAGVKDLFLDLNEARVIMAENARMSGKSRMVVPASAVDKDGRVDLGQDVLVDEGVENFTGEGNKQGPYAVLEYTFQAEQLIAYKNDLVADAMTRVGLAEQFMGGGSHGHEGAAFSAAALRTRLIPTTLAASGKGRYWDDENPKMTRCLQLVDALPQAQGGCGHNWIEPAGAPVVNRTSVLPEDPAEQIDLNVTAVAGEVKSVERAVRELNPSYDDKQVDEELTKIREDRGTFGIAPKKSGEAEQEGAGA